MGKCGGEYLYKPLISSEAKTRTHTKGRKKKICRKSPFPCSPDGAACNRYKWGLTLKPVNCRAVPLPHCTEIALIYTMKAVSKPTTKGPHPFLTKSIATPLFRGNVELGSQVLVSNSRGGWANSQCWAKPQVQILPCWSGSFGSYYCSALDISYGFCSCCYVLDCKHTNSL